VHSITENEQTQHHTDDLVLGFLIKVQDEIMMIMAIYE
jgi:hypothetical protein